MAASPVLSVPCLPSFVSLRGGVHLSGLVCALSPFICLPSCVSLHLSPFMCLPEWWCPPLRSCLCLVSLHSPNSELLGVLNAVLRCPLVSLLVSLCRMVCPPSRWFCLPLSPLVPSYPLLVSLCWMVCPPSRGSCLPLSPRCLPSCFPLLDGASAFPRVLSPLISLC